MKWLVVLAGIALSGALLWTASAQAGGVHVGVFVGGPPVVVAPFPPPIVYVPPPPIDSPPPLIYRPYAPAYDPLPPRYWHHHPYWVGYGYYRPRW